MIEPMKNADNFWLCMDEPTNLMMITSFMEFDDPIDYDRLCATIESRLSKFTRFRKKIVGPVSGIGSPSWKIDENYDIRSHIQRVALPKPGGKTELQEIIGNLMIAPLDQTKPLWQVHLIENYGKGCVVFFRIHHCIADGIALIYVLLSTADTDPDAPWPELSAPEKEKKISLESLLPFGFLFDNAKMMKEKAEKLGKKFLGELTEAINNPEKMKNLIQSVSETSVDAAKLISKLTIMPSDPNTAFKGRLGVRKCIAWTDPIPLDAIKSIGKAIHTSTLNDVLIATVTGAMRRYLRKKNSPVNELDLRVTVPVNIRKSGAETELGNRFSMVFLPLPVYLEDPVLRLQEIKRRMDHLKGSPDAIIGFGVLSALGMLPPVLAKKAAHLFANKASGVLTNVPGPRQPLYFSGRKIRNMMFWVPRSGNIGLGISILSYDGKVTVGIASDEGLMPDPHALLEGFEEEFNHILNLVKAGKIYDDPLVLHDRYKETKCKGVIENGKSCKKKAEPGSDFCKIHKKNGIDIPEEESQRKEEASKKPMQCKGFTKNGKRCKKKVKPEQLKNKKHRTIFIAMWSLWANNNPVDLVTLTNILKKCGDLQQAGGVAYLASLVDYIPKGGK